VRTEAAQQLLRQLKVAVLRGNEKRTGHDLGHKGAVPGRRSGGTEGHRNLPVALGSEHAGVVGSSQSDQPRVRLSAVLIVGVLGGHAHSSVDGERYGRVLHGRASLGGRG